MYTTEGVQKSAPQSFQLLKKYLVQVQVLDFSWDEQAVDPIVTV